MLIFKSSQVIKYYVMFAFLFVQTVVISRFGFEDWSWVLIASVPDLCILFTFTDQHLCFFYKDSTIPLLSKSDVSNL